MTALSFPCQSGSHAWCTDPEGKDGEACGCGCHDARDNENS